MTDQNGTVNKPDDCLLSVRNSRPVTTKHCSKGEELKAAPCQLAGQLAGSRVMSRLAPRPQRRSGLLFAVRLDEGEHLARGVPEAAAL